MTTKTIKTILFASLIAALIIPFSGITNAEVNPATEVLDKIKELKQVAENQKTVSAEEDEINKKYIERLTMAEQLITMQINDKGSTDQAKALEARLISELEKLPKTEMIYDENPAEIGPGDSNNAAYLDQVYGQKAYGSTTNFDTSDIGKTDCSSTSYGDSHGVIISWFTNSYVTGSLISGTDYPSSTTFGCTTKSFDSGFINYYDFSNPLGTCLASYDSSHYIRAGYCPFTLGDIILINANASYQGNSWGVVSSQWIIA